MVKGPPGDDGIIIEINLKGEQDLNTSEEEQVNPNVDVFSLKEVKKIVEFESDHESGEDQEMM